MKRKVLDKYKPLLKLLIEHDMTKQEFANRVGITLIGLRKILTGVRNGRKSTLIRIEREWDRLKKYKRE